MNENILEALKEYKESNSTEGLNKLIAELVKSRILVPAVKNAEGNPVPKLMKNMEGELFFAIYTSKEQATRLEEGIFFLDAPFLMAIAASLNPVDNIKGLVINPFTDNMIFQKKLLERIAEVEKQKKNGMVQVTENQINQFERTQFEVGYIPTQLFTKGQEFIDKLLSDKEDYIDTMYEDSYKEKRLYPYLPEDFSVMPMTLSDELILIRIDMPEKNVAYGNAYRVYIGWNSVTKEAKYFRIVQDKEKGKLLLEEIDSNKKVTRLGEAPAEGTELVKITELLGYSEPDKE